MGTHPTPARADRRRIPRVASAAAIVAAVSGVLVAAVTLSAHDLWIVPNAFAVAGGGDSGSAGVRRAAEVAAPGDSSDVAAVVGRYHAALAAGDSAAALALLAPDAVVLESGGVETRDEYRSHHLPADIGFARAVPSTRGPARVVVRGDVAWVTGTSTTQGEFKGRPINSAGAELMVLSRDASGWKIRAIHWSSRTRRPQGG